MDPEAFRKYLVNRYEDQMNWYQAKAAKCKRRYLFIQWSVIVLSAIVPVLVVIQGLDGFDPLRWVAMAVAILLAIGTAGVKTFKFQEDWINYRSTVERLIQEKFFYDANVGAYNEAESKETLFVERVEALLAGENANWVMTQKTKDPSTP